MSPLVSPNKPESEETIIFCAFSNAGPKSPIAPKPDKNEYLNASNVPIILLIMLFNAFVPFCTLSGFNFNLSILAALAVKALTAFAISVAPSTPALSIANILSFSP